MSAPVARYVGQDGFCDRCLDAYPCRAWMRDQKQLCRRHYMQEFNEPPPAPRTADDLERAR